MAGKIQINRITNANIYLDGNNLLGRASEIKLPDISMIMQEHKALGMVGKIELPAGFDKLEGEIKWNSFYHDVMRNLGRQSFLHGSETLRVHRQINNGAACGEFGDFALRGEK